MSEPRAPRPANVLVQRLIDKCTKNRILAHEKMARIGHGSPDFYIAGAEFAVWADMEDELRKLAAVSETVADPERCECGHHRSMHPFGLSENLAFNGGCMLCNCKEFAPLGIAAPE
jgi:hypothetical protein